MRRKVISLNSLNSSNILSAKHRHLSALSAMSGVGVGTKGNELSTNLRHVALPSSKASPDQRPWETAPGSHRWIGARVAWEFGKDIYAGTCTGWKMKEKVLGCAIWFVSYDDGDTEIFNVAQMRYSLRLHGRTEFRVRAPRTPQKSCAKEEVEAFSPRRSQGVLSTALRASRLAVEQDELLPFPVLISPERLKRACPPAVVATATASDWAAATPVAAVQSRKRKALWREPTHAAVEGAEAAKGAEPQLAAAASTQRQRRQGLAPQAPPQPPQAPLKPPQAPPKPPKPAAEVVVLVVGDRMRVPDAVFGDNEGYCWEVRHGTHSYLQVLSTYKY